MKRTTLLFALLTLIAASTAAFGQAVVIDRIRDDSPQENRPPVSQINGQFRIDALHVTATIHEQVAEVTVNQTFFNPTNWVLEGTYYFPIPETASLSGFAMTMNGEMVEGEVMDAREARQIYNNIVRQIRDPGILEYASRNLFRACVFPIQPNSDIKVRMTYQQIIHSENGLCQFVYPMNVARLITNPIGSFSLTVNMETETPMRALYSPTHQDQADLNRTDDHNAVVGIEDSNVVPSQDFKLYYQLSAEDIGMSLLTFNDAGEDGYFLLTVTPPYEYDEDDIVDKTVIFVVDTSYSMHEDHKMDQAKQALTTCLRSLNAGDSFNIVRFSTSVSTWRDEVMEVSDENVEAAVRFTENLRPSGGTAINDALLRAISMTDEVDGLCMVIFLTDGLPTSGERDAARILENVRGANDNGVRIFNFGVGYDVNTHLLDTLSAETRAARTYVTPGEDLEVAVGSFYDKVNFPVLTDLYLDFEGIEVYDLYPEALPDLFRGTQLVLTGRYRGGSGDRIVTLQGDVNGDKRTFEYEGSFTANGVEDGFIPRLWAIRKVGVLMEQIRLNGESEELRAEIVGLGTRFGIVTPYTSFLVVEDTPAVNRPRPDPVRRMPGGGGRGWGEEDQAPGDDVNAPAPAEPNGADARNDAEELREGMSATSGESAVRASERLRRMSQGESLDDEDSSRLANAGIQHVDELTFYWRDGFWTDLRVLELAEDAEIETVEVEYLSDAYFELLDEHPELGRFFALGETLKVLLDGTVYQVNAPAEEESGD